MCMESRTGESICRAPVETGDMKDREAGMLCSMGSQGVGCDLGTEQQQGGRRHRTDLRTRCGEGARIERAAWKHTRHQV